MKKSTPQKSKASYFKCTFMHAKHPGMSYMNIQKFQTHLDLKPGDLVNIKYEGVKFIATVHNTVRPEEFDDSIDYPCILSKVDASNIKQPKDSLDNQKKSINARKKQQNAIQILEALKKKISENPLQSEEIYNLLNSKKIIKFINFSGN